MKILVLTFFILLLLPALFADYNGLGKPDSILAELSIDAKIDSIFNDALYLINIEPYELSYEKKFGGRDSFRLHIIDSLMDDPLYTGTYSDSLAKIAERSGQRLAPYTIFSCNSLEDSLELPEAYIPNDNTYREYLSLFNDASIPDSLGKRLSYFLAACDSASRLCKMVFDTIPEETRYAILRDAAELWLGQEEDPDSHALEYIFYEYKPELVDSLDEISTRDLLNAMQTLDYQNLYTAYAIYTLAWDSLYSYFSDTLWDIAGIEDTSMSARTREFPEDTGTISVEGIEGGVIADIQSPLGRIIIGGVGENIYRKDFPFVFDIGGNDLYFNRASFTVGYLDRFITGIVDFDGNDSYISDDWFFTQGSSVLGIAGLFDISGNDIYRGGGYSQSSAIVGLSVLFDDDGDNIYRAGEHSQAASTFGISILHSGTIDPGRHLANPASDDDYRAHRYSQGFASVKSFAMLRDMGGDDSYIAGGRYLHEPLHPQHHQSMSQGFGFGWRGSASGGVGFLYDATGNDNYNTQIYGQGSSYWYAFGLLYDVTGHDTYQMGHYGQGAGIHLSVGALVDRIGEDAYYGRRGPSQGCAHDWAVGYMFDGAGADYYSADGIAWGQGHANGTGIFIDKSGPDVYGGKSSGHVQGTASAARGYGGLGIFLDLGGDDRYIRGQGKNNMQWVKGFYGVGVDAEVYKEGPQ